MLIGYKIGWRGKYSCTDQIETKQLFFFNNATRKYSGTTYNRTCYISVISKIDDKAQLLLYYIGASLTALEYCGREGGKVHMASLVRASLRYLRKWVALN